MNNSENVTECDIAKKISDLVITKECNPCDNREDISVIYDLENSSSVSGDFFDYYYIDDTHFAVTIGDISNCGIDAVVFMTIVKTCIKDMALQGYSPSEILNKVNKILLRDKCDSFDYYASVWFGIINTSSGKLICVDAGHTPPMLKIKGGSFEYLRARKNTALAVRKTTVFKETEYILKPGDKLFLYSNGVNETRNYNNELFGKRRIKEYLDDYSEINEDDLIAGLKDKLEKFSGNSVIQDDRIMMFVNFNAYHNVKLAAFVKSEESLDKYGGVNLSITTENLMKMGFEYSDILRVEINGYILRMPLVPDYRYLNSGTTAIIAWPGKDRNCTIFTFGGDFVKQYGFKKDVEYPVFVELYLDEHFGYLNEFTMHDLKRTHNRNDYAHLSDEEFCNFREVIATGLGKGKLYRGSSPVNPYLQRNKYADDALKNHAIKTIVNLDNSPENIIKMLGFDGSYYSTVNYNCFNMNTNYESPVTKGKIADIMRLLGRAEPPIYIHCVEGQDRTGFLTALLVCLVGGTYDEMITDFMKTYYNYYGVERGTIKYASLRDNVLTTLENAFGTDALRYINLQEKAKQFLLSIGLTDAEISAVQSNLSDIKSL